MIPTERRRLERILGNLLDNAREHAPGAPVEVEILTSADEVVLVVADRGSGVPTDRLGRIFERFYKADPSRHGGSSGLGLAIAAEPPRRSWVAASVRPTGRKVGTASSCGCL